MSLIKRPKKFSKRHMEVQRIRAATGLAIDRDRRAVAGVHRPGISGADTNTSTRAIIMPEFGLWLDPPSESDSEADAPIAPRATASRAPR